MIDKAYLKKTLKALLEIPSPTGMADAAADFARAELDALGLTTSQTRRGAVRGLLSGKGTGNARALIAHLDTLGAMVKEIKANGRLRITQVGHWSARFAEGARVTIYSDSGVHRGTVLPLKASGHTFAAELDTQPAGWDHVEVRVDLLASSKEEMETAGIAVGDYIAVDPNPEFLDNGFINSRHLDDKAGVTCILTALKALKDSGEAAAVDTRVFFTVTEETGSGASAVADAEIAELVAVDNGTTAQGQNSKETGVTLAVMDSGGPYDRHLTAQLEELCRRDAIAYQKDLFRFYRSDASAVVASGADLRDALVTFGVDSSHGYERIHLDALVSVSRLLYAYLRAPMEQPFQ